MQAANTQITVGKSELYASGASKSLTTSQALKHDDFPHNSDSDEVSALHVLSRVQFDLTFLAQQTRTLSAVFVLIMRLFLDLLFVLAMRGFHMLLSIVA